MQLWYPMLHSYYTSEENSLLPCLNYLYPVPSFSTKEKYTNLQTVYMLKQFSQCPNSHVCTTFNKYLVFSAVFPEQTFISRLLVAIHLGLYIVMDRRQMATFCQNVLIWLTLRVNCFISLHTLLIMVFLTRPYDEERLWIIQITTWIMW